MKKQTLILILTLLLGITSVKAYTFRVLANKGQNKVKKGDTKEIIPLLTGDILNIGDELITDKQNVYIGLIHKSGKTLEVRTSGTQTAVSELEELIEGNSVSLTTRYARFLIDKMNNRDKGDYQSYLLKEDAPERGEFEDIIHIMAPQNIAKVLGKKIIVSWDAPPNIKKQEFIVTVRNIFDEVVLEKKVNDNKIALDLESNTMKDGAGLYIISVMSKTNPKIKSTRIGIKRIKDEEAKELLESLRALKNEIPEEKALNKLVYASFYAKNGLILDALTKVEELIIEHPDIEDLKFYKDDIVESSKLKTH